MSRYSISTDFRPGRPRQPIDQSTLAEQGRPCTNYGFCAGVYLVVYRPELWARELLYPLQVNVPSNLIDKPSMCLERRTQIFLGVTRPQRTTLYRVSPQGSPAQKFPRVAFRDVPLAVHGGRPHGPVPNPDSRTTRDKYCRMLKTQWPWRTRLRHAFSTQENRLCGRSFMGVLVIVPQLDRKFHCGRLRTLLQRNAELALLSTLTKVCPNLTKQRCLDIRTCEKRCLRAGS